MSAASMRENKAMDDNSSSVTARETPPESFVERAYDISEGYDNVVVGVKPTSSDEVDREVNAERQLILDKLTLERNRVLDEWADPDTLGLSPEEVAVNVYQRSHLKFLFGETGFNPSVPARNPVSVSMHNPRFSAALWAINTEVYRRKGWVSADNIGPMLDPTSRWERWHSETKQNIHVLVKFY